jgi:acylphosphatase
MIARQIRVSGRVQGVGFRWSARSEAEAAGVAGWVRNRADGGVEAHVQGPVEAVERVVAWLRHGPGPARVTGFEAVDVQPLVGIAGFEIRP